MVVRNASGGARLVCPVGGVRRRLRDRLFSVQCRAMHQPLTVEWVGIGAVHGAGVVPEEKIAHFLLVPVDVLRLCGPVHQPAQEHAAVFRGGIVYVQTGGTQQQ